MLSVVFLLLLISHSFAFHHPLCHDDDRSLLLLLKHSFVFDTFSCDPSTNHSKLSSWQVGADCCSWDGVDCDVETGHVIGLDLSSSCLYGSINSSSPLFRIIHLKSLDLSYNNFNLSAIPDTIRNLKSLEVFAASKCHFGGVIPSSVGNLTNLDTLDLSSNYFSGEIPYSLGDLIGLTFLDLSLNNFSQGALNWVGALTNLQALNLTKTNTFGAIPSSFRNLTQLTALFLGFNQVTGQIPTWMGNLTQLTQLSIAYNELEGPIPESIFKHPYLQLLHLDDNNLSGLLKFDSFLQMQRLTDLYLANNQLSIVSSPYMNVTLRKFRHLGLGGCNLREFPAFLRDQNEIEILDLSSNSIEGDVPDWLFASKRLFLLSLYNNSLTGLGCHLDTLSLPNLQMLYLSCNQFRGPLPLPPPSMVIYAVSQNKFEGHIPHLFCNLTSGLVFDFSINNLSGTLPACLGNGALVLDLRNNGLSGAIPDKFTSGCKLKLIDFGQNLFEGKVPKSLANCSDLGILNLDENQMNDVFPSWLSILPQLRVLSLRSNQFHGALRQPLAKFEFGSLQIIDISDNNFRGKLPLEYFQSWVAMKSVDEGDLSYMRTDINFDIPGYPFPVSYHYPIRIVSKGTDRAYNRIPEFSVVADLSSNKFEGEIPETVGNLRALQSLNLSNNMLTSRIPSSLGNLTMLEALDLSQNNLSGHIPPQLSFCTFLAVFNVSHNSLTGPIPRGNQFDTFDSSSFIANPGLCGDVLPQKCGETPHPGSDEEDDDESPIELNWEIVLIGCGTGLVIGISFGCALNTRKYEWLVNKFANGVRRMR